MRFIGIDYSITSPGICINYGDSFYLYGFYKESLEFDNITLFKYPKWNTLQQRYDLLSETICDLLSHDDMIAIEGYAYGGSGRVFNIAENCGILKHKIYKKFDIDCIEYSPSEIKKFATNNGNANKDMMVDKFVETTNYDIFSKFKTKKGKIGGPTSDLADSYWISKYLENNYTLTLNTLTPTS